MGMRQIVRREGSIERVTNETHIIVSLNLDGSGQA
jgi:imidazoleglycerol phosphate dehydratase HisB